MSHAANLRNRQRPSLPQSTSPEKRRKLDSAAALPIANGIDHSANHVLPYTKLKAKPVKDVKHHKLSSKHIPKAPVILAGDNQDADEDDSDGNIKENGVSLDEHSSDDEVMEGQNGIQAVTETAAEPESSTEPSFGDLLRARNLDIINVEPAGAGQSEPTLATSATAPRALSVPSAASLGTVLTQALKTNDAELLESCLQVPSLDSIRATVQRLHPTYAAILLQRLAECLHKRPGRAGSLMVWVQWTIVAHGGYLAGQATTMREIHTLYQVVKQRATGLQPLLALKGRLDMLEAQLQMRRNLQARSSAAGDRNDDGVIYVEDEESAEDEDNTSATRSQSNKVGSSIATQLKMPDSEEEGGEMPLHLTNGEYESEDAVELDESEEDEGLFDEEAEESENESEEQSDEVDYDDADDMDEAEEDDLSEDNEQERPLKRSKASQYRSNDKRK